MSFPMVPTVRETSVSYMYATEEGPVEGMNGLLEAELSSELDKLHVCKFSQPGVTPLLLIPDVGPGAASPA